MESTTQRALKSTRTGREYLLQDEFYRFSGNAQWTFAECEGRQWFVKRFYNPEQPDRSDLDKDYFESELLACQRFYESKTKLYNAVNECNNGNIVTIEDFFCTENRYHVVTERVPVEETLTAEYIAKIGEDEKYLIMKVLADSFATLHQQHIVHADIRPDNVLYKRSLTGKIVPKLIDFDGSYIEGEQPSADGLPISERYLAPETARVHYDHEELRLTTKVDVFSLGLLFHEYWAGELPRFDECVYEFPFDAILNGPGVELSRMLPSRLEDLIRKMLSKEPEDRPEMKTVFSTLKRISEGLPDMEDPTETVYGSKPVRENDSGFVFTTTINQPVMGNGATPNGDYYYNEFMG